MHASMLTRIENLLEEIKLIQNRERFYCTVKRYSSGRMRHTPGAKFDFLNCKLNSESCKKGRCAPSAFQSSLQFVISKPDTPDKERRLHQFGALRVARLTDGITNVVPRGVLVGEREASQS
jgi:hypothetical protein